MDDDLFTYDNTSRVSARGRVAAALRQSTQSRPPTVPRKKSGSASASKESSSSDEDSSPGKGGRTRRRKKRNREEESVAARLMCNKAVAMDPAEGDSSLKGLQSPVKSPTVNSRSYCSSSSPSPSPSPPPLDFTSPPDMKSLHLQEKAERALYQLKWSKVPYSPIVGVEEYSIHDDSSVLMPGDDITLRVRCRGKVHKYKTMMVQPLSTVCTLLADDVGTSAELILLSHRNNTLNPTETPHNLGLTTADIIDAVVLNNPTDSVSASSGVASLDTSLGDHSITIKIQTSKRSITYRMQKSDPLQKAMNAFAEELSVPIAKLKFVFDGEQVEPSNTPQDLDMESDDVMDAQTVP